jgi:hypothetical protein
MAIFSFSIEVTKPVKEVFEYYTNVKTWKEWNLSTVYAELENGGPMSTGTKIRGSNKVMGKVSPWIASVTDFKQNERFSQKFELTGMWFIGKWSVEEQETFSSITGGTRLDSKMTLKTKGLYNVWMPIVASSFRKQMIKDMAEFKSKLESRK